MNEATQTETNTESCHRLNSLTDSSLLTHAIDFHT